MSLAKMVLVAAALALAPALASGAGKPPQASTFVDAAGRKVEPPTDVARVIPAGPPAVALIAALAPEKLAGLLEPWPDARRPFAPDAYRSLPILPRLTRSISEADLDALRRVQADLIVDYGDVGGAYALAADRAQAALGIPCILLDGRMAEIPGVLHRLGVMLGRRDRGDELAALAEQIIERLHPAASVEPEKRVSVYLGRGADGLLGVRPGGLAGEAIEEAGGANVTPPGAGAFTKLSLLDVVALRPAVAIFEDPAAAAGPLAKTLDPKTIILVDRGGPFGAMEAPPSVNRLVGALALATILHPDLAPADARLMRELRERFFGPLPEGAAIIPLERVR
ncbi:ABC transporter substrate-binding protein [Methylocapsa acidiphila]|uniref:ABC transporter substrate-binding protein n=1 Tax=Methylocapsa acidiphila TaxID=133552 RepID=UPI000415FAF9|nr:ABC transporter substrate-binding protein [Methylocapsa acidiphila]